MTLIEQLSPVFSSVRGALERTIRVHENRHPITNLRDFIASHPYKNIGRNRAEVILEHTEDFLKLLRIADTSSEVEIDSMDVTFQISWEGKPLTIFDWDRLARIFVAILEDLNLSLTISHQEFSLSKDLTTHTFVTYIGVKGIRDYNLYLKIEERLIILTGFFDNPVMKTINPYAFSVQITYPQEVTGLLQLKQAA